MLQHPASMAWSPISRVEKSQDGQWVVYYTQLSLALLSFYQAFSKNLKKKRIKKLNPKMARKKT
jgi:hypothetical protein